MWNNHLQKKKKGFVRIRTERTADWDVWTCTPHSWNMSSQSQQDISLHYISPWAYVIELSFITLLPRVSKHLAGLLETTLWRKCMESALFPITLNAFRYSVLQHPFQVHVPVGLPEAKVFKTCFPENALPIWLFENFFPVISFLLHVQPMCPAVDLQCVYQRIDLVLRITVMYK